MYLYFWTSHVNSPKDEMGSLAAQLDLLPRVKHSVASVARLLEVSSEVVLQALQVRGSRWMKIEEIRERHGNQLGT